MAHALGIVISQDVFVPFDKSSIEDSTIDERLADTFYSLCDLVNPESFDDDMVMEPTLTIFDFTDGLNMVLELLRGGFNMIFNVYRTSLVTPTASWLQDVLFTLADTNNDGAITLEEFSALLSTAFA